MLKVFNSIRLKKPFSKSKDKDKDNRKGKKKSSSEPELGSASAAGELESEGASSVVTKKPSTTETGPSSSTSATTDTSKATTSVTTTAGGAVAASVPLTEQTPGKSVNSIGQSEEVRGSGKKKKSPSHSGSGKSGKSSSKKKSVEFINERSVDEPVKKSIQEENHGYDYPDKDSKGVWTPGITNNSQGSSSASQQPLLVIKQQESHSSKRRGSKDQVAPDSDARELPDLEEPPPPVWTPPNAPSPSTQKKFRPVNFNVPGSPVSSTPHTVSLERSVSAGQVAERKVSFGAGDVHSVPSTQPQRQGQRKPEISGDLSRVEGGGSIHQNHNLHQSQSSPSVNLPKYQSPTVTLLQKAREGHLPKGALYLDHKIPGVQRSSSASGGFNSLLPQQHPVAGPSSSSQQPSSLNPNDTLYELKREDYRSTPTGATSRRADFTPKKYDGVGPTTPDGVPIALKSGINNGHEWYRRMYESLHVDNKPQRKGAPLRSPYGGPASGSWSEPEGYESDTYAYKYATLDRRKLRDRYASDTEYLSPGPSTPTSIPGSIRFVPGRIEDYTPGNSSVAAKEIRRHKPTLQWALGSKDLGYESDSNLVIKKRQESQEIPPPPPLSPAEQRQVYVEIQKGGEVPLHGLRKPAPEKPKEYEGVIGPIPPNRNSHQASQNGILSPPPPPSASSSQTLMSNNAVRNNRFLRQGGGYDEDDGKQSENQSTLVESQFRRQAQLNNNVSSEPESSAASPLLPAPVKYAVSEVNIHYKAPVRLVEKDYIGEEELRRRQQIVMRRFYEEQRHRKFLAEIQDMENRRHTDNFTPSQKSPIPLNRYEDMIDEPQRPRWREKTPDQKIVAKALFNFVPQNSRELSFRKGDILFIRRKLDANWFEGEHNAAVGIFPSSYVEIIPSYEIDRATPRIPSEGQARVRFNFTAASPVEMSIIKGETVVLTRRVDVNWYEGRIGSRRGIFPVSYVQVLKEPGSDLTASLSPKPVGSPAAHSLATHHNQNFRHNYKPNDYAINSEFTSLHSSPPASIPNYSSRGNYGGGRLSQSGAQQQGHSSYSQNLTIDTRIEPLSYKAIYNYRPAHEDELELQENDIVHVLEKCDDGWFVGTSTRTGLFGTFPGNYVERVF